MTEPDVDAVMASVERRMGGSFEWGVADCCAGPCAVFADLTGVDPMARLRGEYTGRAGTLTVIRGAGGLWRLAHRLAREAGLRAVPEARPGDIGLVRNGFGHSLAICIGPGWAAKASPGFTILPKAEVAWRV
jgi:hypothetical protein